MVWWVNNRYIRKCFDRLKLLAKVQIEFRNKNFFILSINKQLRCCFFASRAKKFIFLRFNFNFAPKTLLLLKGEKEEKWKKDKF